MGKALKVVAGIALIAAVVVFAPALSGFLTTALGGTFAAAGIAANIAMAVVAVGVAAGAGLAMSALAPTPKTPKAQPFNFRNSVSNSFIIIGKRRQGGKLVFYHPSKVGSTHYRHFIWAAAGHRCNGVTKWYLNDEEVTVDGSGLVTTGKYANNAWLWFGRGTYDTDETPAGWRSETGGKWTTDHKLLGVAKIYAKFKMTKDVVSAGMPTMTAEIEGTDEVYDPRDDTTGYSRNAALAFYWWLQLPREDGGFGAAADEIPDDDLLSAWANVCDEMVDDGESGTEERYALDSLIECGAPPSQVRDTFVTCCAGSFTYSEGVFLMRPGYWSPPSTTLFEEDLAGGIRVSPMLEGDEVANEVTGTFVNPGDLYQAAPIPTRSVASDNVRQVDFDLPHVTSHARGQRILEIMLRRAQCEKRVTWPMNIAGLETRAMQTVQLDTSRYGLNNYAWIIDNWGLSADYGVTLGLREENSEIYDDPTLHEFTGASSPDSPEDIPEEADSATLLGNTYGVPDIDSILARLDDLEGP